MHSREGTRQQWGSVNECRVKPVHHNLRMKITVLGATGQTGQFLVDQALQQGHTVTAVVRNPAKLTIHHDNLKVTSLSPFTAQDLTKSKVPCFIEAV